MTPLIVMKKLLMLLIWFPSALVTLTISLIFYSYRYAYLQKKSQLNLGGFNIFAQVLGFSYDLEEEKVKAYLTKYHSPMKSSAGSLVKSAKSYQIDPFLIVAIAQCETNLGKKSPPDCYNPFGLGIYGKRTICFNNWEESFELMAKTLRKKYFDYGLDTPEKIMEKYCPASIENADGHWAKCVIRFKTEAENTIL